MSATGDSSLLFRTEKNQAFPGVSLPQLNSMQAMLENEFGVMPVQIVEAASYSMAMVVRFALGLYAEGGKVMAFCGDQLSGYVALATLRHLIAAGAGGAVYLVQFEGRKPSDLLQIQLKPLRRLGVEIISIDGSSPLPEHLDHLVGSLESSHNVICGLFDRGNPALSLAPAIIEALNDTRAPLHSVEAPHGLDVECGKAGHEVLFSSSTMSLGAPLRGLHAGQEHVGRHYVCDTSFCDEIYRLSGPNLCPIFSEQPVVKIIPVNADVAQG